MKPPVKALSTLFFGTLFLCLCPSVYAVDVTMESALVEKTTLFIFQLGIILVIARLGAFVFKRLKMPAVLGELIAGIIIGPYCLGSISLPGFSGGIFPILAGFPISRELYAITTIASIVLLFVVGLETDIKALFKYSLAGSLVGIFGVIFSFIFGDLAGVIFSQYVFGEHYTFSHPVPVFLGIISTATSVGISARILSEKKKTDSPEGVTILAAAVIDDVLGILILAVVIGVVKSGYFAWKHIGFISLRAVFIWLGVTFLGIHYSRYISEFLKSFGNKRIISIMGFALALLLAGVFEKSGLAMIIGAYTMGLSLSKTDIAYIIRENLLVFHYFFVPIFFCVMGMMVNLREMTSGAIFLFALIYIIFAILGKMIGCCLPALLLNFNLRGALRIGVGMMPRGEVALIIAGVGLSQGIIPHDVFSICVIMTFVTTLITPPILARQLSSDKPVLRKEPPYKKEHEEIVYTMPNQETAELLLSKVIKAFENEGFFIYLIESESLYEIRKNGVFISLKYSTEKLEFSCFAEDVSFIHTLFYEVISELESFLKKAKTLSDKNEIGMKIFDTESSMLKKEMLIADVLSPLALEVNLKADTKEEIIKELIGLLVSSGQLKSAAQNEVMRDIFEREASMSTGMQDGIALPHAKTFAVPHVAAVVGLKKNGAEFNSLDKKPSTIFVMTLSPKTTNEPYLQFMAEISKVLTIPENRNKLLASETTSQMYEILTAQE
ncbi:MAG: cation:proton antiporter [Candidatus Omnitrophica bacterium]|nr:cation:proton antiporter [Candidatus Omnitrophota bacterium]MBU4479236.1 cation:proton antiporter [Candidatus Omnitrophota bacterium]MCG2703926.1 cation:proton antiporter [Candidatus Omnitrophota bacterium]